MRPFIYLTALLLFSVGCTSSSVRRMEADQPVDLSGYWNDQDAKITATEISNQILESRWLRSAEHKSTHRPTLMANKVKNLTTEHIETATLINQISKNLSDSNRFEMVASQREKLALRKERKDHQKYDQSVEGIKVTKEKLADLMMTGSIQSTIDQVENKKLVVYQVDIKLIRISDHQVVFTSQSKIKKLIEKPNVQW